MISREFSNTPYYNVETIRRHHPDMFLHVRNNTHFIQKYEIPEQKCIITTSGANAKILNPKSDCRKRHTWIEKCWIDDFIINKKHEKKTYRYSKVFIDNISDSWLSLFTDLTTNEMFFQSKQLQELLQMRNIRVWCSHHQEYCKTIDMPNEIMNYNDMNVGSIHHTISCISLEGIERLLMTSKSSKKLANINIYHGLTKWIKDHNKMCDRVCIPTRFMSLSVIYLIKLENAKLNGKHCDFNLYKYGLSMNFDERMVKHRRYFVSHNNNKLSCEDIAVITWVYVNPQFLFDCENKLHEKTKNCKHIKYHKEIVCLSDEEVVDLESFMYGLARNSKYNIDRSDFISLENTVKKLQKQLMIAKKKINRLESVAHSATV